MEQLTKIMEALDKFPPKTIVTTKLLKGVIASVITEDNEEETVDMSKVFSMNEDF